MEFVPILKKEEIKKRIAETAKKISEDYKSRELILIGVLKGAFVFLSDLARSLADDRIKVDFLQAASYGSGSVSSEKIVLKKDIDIDINNKDILIVEDIVDTGITLSYLIEHLKTYHPKSIKICAMIDKRERRKSDIKVDYACSVVEDGFLVGYGLDYAEDYRNLPDIYHLKF